MYNANPFLVANESEIDALIEQLKIASSKEIIDKDKIKFYLESLHHQIQNCCYGVTNSQLENFISLLVESHRFPGIKNLEKIYIIKHLMIPNMNITPDLVRKVIGNVGINTEKHVENKFIDSNLQKELIKWLVCVIMVQSHNNFEKLNRVLIQMNTVLLTLIGLNTATAQYVTQLCYLTDISKCLDIVKLWKLDYLRDLCKKNMDSSVYVRALLQYYTSIFNNNQKFKVKKTSADDDDDLILNDFEEEGITFESEDFFDSTYSDAFSSLDLRRIFKYPDMKFLDVWKRVLDGKLKDSSRLPEHLLGSKNNLIPKNNITSLKRPDKKNYMSDDEYDNENNNGFIPTSKDIDDIKYSINETVEEQNVFIKVSIPTNGNKRYKLSSDEEDTLKYFRIIQPVEYQPSGHKIHSSKDLINWSKINYTDLSDFIVENLALLEIPVSQLPLLFEARSDNLKIYLVIELLLNYGTDSSTVISQIDKYFRLVVMYGYNNDIISTTSLPFIKTVINGIYKLSKVGNCVRIPIIREILLLQNFDDDNNSQISNISDDIQEYIILKFFTMFSILDGSGKEPEKNTSDFKSLKFTDFNIFMKYNKYFLTRGKANKQFIYKFVKTLIIAFKKWIFEIKYSHDDDISIENDKLFNSLLEIYDIFQISILKLLMNINNNESKEGIKILEDDDRLTYYVIQFVSLIEYFPIDDNSINTSLLERKNQNRNKGENEDKIIRYYYFRIASPLLVIFLLIKNHKETKMSAIFSLEDINQLLIIEYMKYVCLYPLDELSKSLKTMELNLVNQGDDYSSSNQAMELENVRNELKYLNYCNSVKVIYSRFLQYEEQTRCAIKKNDIKIREGNCSFWELLVGVNQNIIQSSNDRI